MSRIPLLRLAQVDSTQAFLRRHPELHPCAALAEAQTEGRGRQGNRWESAPGAGLWLSVSLQPPELPPGLLLQRAMAQVADLLSTPEIPLGLKWPNDLVAREGGGLVKVGGILGERVGPRLILGLGVNLTAAPHLPDRAMPARSLRDLGLPVPDPGDLARALLDRWRSFQESPPPTFRWPEAGEAFRWEGGQGVCLGWEPDGRLKVTTAGGVQRLSSGEVRSLRSRDRHGSPFSDPLRKI